MCAQLEFDDGSMTEYFLGFIVVNCNNYYYLIEIDVEYCCCSDCDLKDDEECINILHMAGYDNLKDLFYDHQDKIGCIIKGSIDTYIGLMHWGDTSDEDTTDEDDMETKH